MNSHQDNVPALRDYLQIADHRVDIRFQERDRGFAQQTAVTLRMGIEQLIEYFELDSPLPRVRAFLSHDRAAFDKLVADILHVEIERPSNPSRIAQPQRTDIVLLSPSAYAGQSDYEYEPGDFDRMVYHELVHVFEEHLSPDIEASQLWWSEGLAVYLSDQWRHASQFGFREPVLQAIREGKAPAFADILQDLSLAYAFGWTLIRFIEQTRGKAAIVRAVRQVDDGNVLGELDEDPAQFGRAWQQWLLEGDGARL